MALYFHYLSPNGSISIDVYRHTLCISINGTLTSSKLSTTVTAFNEAVASLNDRYLYWGQIVSLNSEFIIDCEIVTSLMSGIFDKNTDKRKCCAIVVLPTVDHRDRSIDSMSTYFPAVPWEIFKTLPQAMEWVDTYMNDYASKAYAR